MTHSRPRHAGPSHAARRRALPAATTWSEPAPAADAAIPDSLLPQLEHLLDAAVAEGVAPAISCAVVLQGRALPVLTAGTATADTLFDLASVTKLFTTVVALSLVDGGVLHLDRPIAAQLPAYADGAKAQVTLRQLLTHTSGLPAEWRGWEAALDAGHGFVRAELLRDLLATALEAPPGTRMRYSCAGFNTIMALAETATGLPWDRLVRDLALAPLKTGATVTGRAPLERSAPTEYQPGLGRGLVQGIVHDEAAWSLGGLSGNAGLFATAAGLARFGEALRTGLDGILSPALAADMWRSQLPELLGSHFDRRDPGFEQGLGLRINQQPAMGAAGEHARGHSGFTGTSLLVDKTRGITIALLSNRISPRRDGDDATVLRWDVANLVYAAGRTSPWKVS